MFKLVKPGALAPWWF